MKVTLKQLPFDPVNRPTAYCPKSDLWFDNTPFFATMRIQQTLFRGMSACRFRWIDQRTNKEHQMFPRNMADLVHNHVVTRGVVTGYWAYCKRGDNYGLIYLGETI